MPARLFGISIILLAASLTYATGADGSPVPAPQWAAGFDNSDLRGNVTALTFHNGELVVASEVLLLNRRQAGEHIARWNGRTWKMCGDPIYTGCIRVLGEYRGCLVAGGEFRCEPGAGPRNLARLDGTRWRSFGEPQIDGIVQALTVFRGDLIIGGAYTIPGQSGVSNIARWDGRRWHGLAGGVSGAGARVAALTVWKGRLVAAGVFSHAGETTARNIATWDGTRWTALGGGIADEVRCVTVYDKSVVAGGRFLSAGDSAAARIAAWDGARWKPLGSGLGSLRPHDEPVVHALVVWNGVLVAGGYFERAGGVKVFSAAKWDGHAWSGFADDFSVPLDGVCSDGVPVEFSRPKAFVPPPPEPQRAGTVRALAVGKGSLFAAGSFDRGAGRHAVQAVARWDDTAWQPVRGGQGLGPDLPWVSSIVDYADDTIIGGRFLLAGTTRVSGLARWRRDHWEGIGNWAGSDGEQGGNVEGIAVWRGGLVILGSFHRAADQWLHHVALWDGARWRPLGAGFPYDRTVRGHIAVWRDQPVVAASFCNDRYQSVTVLAAWDGTAWQPFGDLPEDAEVLALAVYRGDLIATIEQRRTRSVFVGRWDGSRWHHIKDGAGARATAFTVLRDDLVAGFSSFALSDTATHSVMRWNGTDWRAIGSNLSCPEQDQQTLAGGIGALAVFGDRLIIGGSFVAPGDQGSRGLAYWTGSGWSRWGQGAVEMVSALLPAKTSLWAGGRSWRRARSATDGILRWDGPLPRGDARTHDAGRAQAHPVDRPVGSPGLPLYAHPEMRLPSPGGPGLPADSTGGDWGWLARGDHDQSAPSVVVTALADSGLTLTVARETSDYSPGDLLYRFPMTPDHWYRVIVEAPDGSRPGPARPYMSLRACKARAGGFVSGADLATAGTGLFAPSAYGREEVLLRAPAGTEWGLLAFTCADRNVPLTIRSVNLEEATRTPGDIAADLATALRDFYAGAPRDPARWRNLAARWRAELDSLGGRSRFDLMSGLSRCVADLGDSNIHFIDSQYCRDMEQWAPEGPSFWRGELPATIRAQMSDWHVGEGGSEFGTLRGDLLYWRPRGPEALLLPEWRQWWQKLRRQLMGAAGLIIDLRGLRGVRIWSPGAGLEAGSEAAHRAVARLAGLFTEHEVVYGHAQPRSPIAPDAYEAPVPLRLQSAGPEARSLPIACLIDRGCSGLPADFALMLAALPNVALIGASTGPVTGFGALFALPNGVRVYYPRQRLLFPDGRPVNETGVMPGIRVAPAGADDPAFAAAVDFLRARIGSN